jgi:hypothetical protein
MSSWCTSQPLDMTKVSSADGVGLQNRVECLAVFHPEALGEPPKDPTSIVPIQRTIRLEIVLEDPLVSHHIGPRGTWYQVRHFVGEQGLILLVGAIKGTVGLDMNRESKSSRGVPEEAKGEDSSKWTC